MALSLEVRDSVNYAEWNAMISISKLASIGQCGFWAERIQKLYNCRPFFFVVRADKEAVLALLAFEFQSYFVKGDPISAWLRDQVKRVAFRLKYFQWYDQPVVLKDGWGNEAYPFLLQEIERFCRRRRIARVVESQLPHAAMRMAEQSWKAREWATLVVNLSQDEKALWENIKKTARKAIRKAVDDGITVRRITNQEDLPRYFEFARKSAARYYKRVYREDLEITWHLFRGNAIFEIFLAEKDDEILASLGVWGFNGNIIEIGSFQSEKSVKEKLYGSDLIKWEILRWGSQQRLRSFDLAGIHPYPETEKDRGIRQFKEKWGGEYLPYCLVSKTIE